MATPMRFSGYGTHVLNVSISTQQDAGAVEAALARPLRELASAIEVEMVRLEQMEAQ